jgi:hypothetical protein
MARSAWASRVGRSRHGPQRGELARADQEGQQHRAEQHAAEGVEVHVPQADDGEEQIAAGDREVGQGAGPGGGLSRRRHVAGRLAHPQLACGRHPHDGQRQHQVADRVGEDHQVGQ